VLPPPQLTPEHRTAWGNAVDGLAAKSTGTGLYDTIMAAYTSARTTTSRACPTTSSCSPTGRNEGDDDSITAAQLTAELDGRQGSEPARSTSVW
jgi:hypothetical protein